MFQVGDTFQYWRYFEYCGIVFVILDVKLDILKVVPRVVYGYCPITNFRSQFRYYSRTRQSADKVSQTMIPYACLGMHFISISVKKTHRQPSLGAILSESGGRLK